MMPNHEYVLVSKSSSRHRKKHINTRSQVICSFSAQCWDDSISCGKHSVLRLNPIKWFVLSGVYFVADLEMKVFELVVPTKESTHECINPIHNNKWMLKEILSNDRVTRHIYYISCVSMANLIFRSIKGTYIKTGYSLTNVITSNNCSTSVLIEGRGRLISCMNSVGLVVGTINYIRRVESVKKSKSQN